METNLVKYLRARRPIIWINSGDYKEIDTIVKEATKDYQDKTIYEYRALGAVDFETKVKEEDVTDLYNFLDTLYSEGIKTNAFLLIKNAEEEMKDAKNIAYIKKIAETRYSSPDYNFTIIVVSEVETVPKELEKFTSILDIPNMSKDEIEKYILKFSKDNNIKVDEKDIGEVAISLKGLTKLEIDHVLNMIIESKNNISISGRDIIIKEKGQIIKKSSILEIIDFKEKIEDIGGLEGLKEWLKSKAQIFRRLDEAKKFGVDTPKGVLLVGMPGCGKSLAAKASARLFNVPLLRLDIGRLLGKYVGESEHNMRVALKTAESISPCILWIDEIEKAFAGINQDGGASDITKRLFGQFLTWLQEKENTVFVVATANDVTVFPPEFFRKGRFDEIFFIDFPNEEEREKIFKIHLEKRGKLNDIEEVVKMTVETVFNIEDIENEEDSKLRTQDLLDSIKSIDSLSNILADKIEDLKKGYDKFKIKSASQEVRYRRPKLEDMVIVNGGKYKPSFFNEEIEIFDIEVYKYLVTNKMWNFEKEGKGIFSYFDSDSVSSNIASFINSNRILISNLLKNFYSDYKEEKNESHNFSFIGYKNPRENISWWDILRYCNELSKRHNLEPVYNITYDNFHKPILKINQIGESPVEPDKADFRKTEGFRLPTEVEWEWFARGGEIAIQDGTFNKIYAGNDNVEKVAWYANNSNKETHYVGTKLPNQLGLYDCSGNVWEWCYDTFSSSPISKKVAYIFDIYEDNRVLRGGSWKTTNSDCKVTFRTFSDSNNRVNDIGFRIVRTV